MRKIAKVSDIHDTLCVSSGFKSFALFKIKGTVYCIDNRCTHLFGPLCKGKTKGFNVACPWHGSTFDIRTGKVKKGPTKKPIKSYKVTIKDGDIYIDI